MSSANATILDIKSKQKTDIDSTDKKFYIYPNSSLSFSEYIFTARENYFNNMRMKEFLKNFYLDIQRNMTPRLNTVLFNIEGNNIMLYSFIEGNDINAEKRVIHENGKLFDLYPKFIFDFLVASDKYLKNYENTSFEKIL